MGAEKMAVSRRGFLEASSAVVAGLGLGVFGAGASQAWAASEGEGSETSAAEPAGDWLGAAPEISEDEIIETVDVDVLVVGAGVTGLFCAAAVGEAGGNVLVVEKQSVPGMFRTDIGGIDSRLQKELGVSIDKAGLINDIQRYVSGQADGRLLKVWADESGEAIDWMLDMFDEAGIEYYLETDPGAEDMIYKEWTVTHGFNSAMDGMNALVAKVEGAGGEIRYNTRMMKLEREDGGRITGAICQNVEDETYLRVNAEKGVVLATGGFATNNDMLAALCPDVFGMCVKKEMTPSQDGDGIKAALWVGADMDPDSACVVFERGLVPFGPQFDCPSDDAAIWWPGSQPFLRVTAKGERFSNESTPYDFSLHAIHQQHDNTWVQIFDSTWQDQIAQFKTVGCSRIVDPGTMPGWQPTMPMEAITGMFEGYLEGGLIQQADSIAELAELIGADPETLEQTVNRYNELCEKGVDEDFYKESSRMLALTQPPFYAARMGGMLLCTQQGLTVNADMHVLDTEGEVIEGLYVTGNDCGGTAARTYPSRVAGLAMGRNITFSRHIARVIMEG